MGHRARFVAQHDARRHGDGTVTIFDNESGLQHGVHHRARGLVLSVNTRTRKAKLVHVLRRHDPVYSESQGNVQELYNGHYLIGWGGFSPYISEFDHDGRLVFDARLTPKGNVTYRAYRSAWHAFPLTQPAVVAQARSAAGPTDVWMSWNGATEVATWDVLAGSSPTSLQQVASVPRNAFETKTTLSGTYAFVAVRARSARGSVLGTSRTIAPGAIVPKR